MFPLRFLTFFTNRNGSDLDGDKYFVCWDHTITPCRDLVKDIEVFPDDPFSLSLSSSQTRRSITNIALDTAELFVRLNRSSLFGSASKEWQRVVENAPKLADSEYPKELARIVAVALVCQIRPSLNSSS